MENSSKLTRRQHLCAATPGIVDACVGDSGGPLDCFDTKRKKYSLSGIVSFGKNCADKGLVKIKKYFHKTSIILFITYFYLSIEYAGVYTNVPFYREWIRSIILNSANSQKQARVRNHGAPCRH